MLAAGVYILTHSLGASVASSHSSKSSPLLSPSQAHMPALLAASSQFLPSARR